MNSIRDNQGLGVAVLFHKEGEIGRLVFLR